MEHAAGRPTTVQLTVRLKWCSVTVEAALRCARARRPTSAADARAAPAPLAEIFDNTQYSDPNSSSHFSLFLRWQRREPFETDRSEILQWLF
ncbi:hypothetical protein EVAR_29547_1 [Eumeta japonica]|uniref:Uncharacterized protein n=1 Tax=Eumeta variegata TaxID=151549 RepID=A0A4C1WIH9_EUMVA|nr:hypothetical protein EVAR_29547_1 [Eumeta japonica]